VCEARVHRQGFIDPQFLHHHEAQAVHEAVRLVMVALEVGESRALFFGARPMDARQFFGVELLTDASGLSVADLQRERDCFSNHVIRREQMVCEPEILERAKNFNDARMMLVLL
jgi:hypothetical protein